MIPLDQTPDPRPPISAQKVFVYPRDAGLPSGSWWLTATREQFSAMAQREAKRMAVSKWGRTQISTTDWGPRP